MHGRHPTRTRPTRTAPTRTVTAEINASIEREKADILAFLDSDYEDEQFTGTISCYYGRIGHLIGFNVPPRVEIEEQIKEAAAMEEAEAILNESGIYVVPNDENLDPCRIFDLSHTPWASIATTDGGSLPVVPAFYLLRQRANELGIQVVPNAGQPVAIFDYFERNYVRGHDGRPPLFPVHSWNHHDSVLQDLGRTNNAQEGFHLALRMQFNSVHPPLSKVITVLKKEERIAADKLRQYELDPTQGIRIRERKKTYPENDLAIRNLVEGFDAIENPNEDEILAHLRSLQYRLMRNDFENWDDPNGD
ncbi:hypothetical protein niasHT_007821 [Heterodera trifolii]|uniref:Uncharacterized protein n=1 Tax=Heterodera trifolii TaxID=157864 RepID=A0ABD2LZ98_9BILA